MIRFSDLQQCKAQFFLCAIIGESLISVSILVMLVFTQRPVVGSHPKLPDLSKSDRSGRKDSNQISPASGFNSACFGSALTFWFLVSAIRKAGKLVRFLSQQWTMPTREIPLVFIKLLLLSFIVTFPSQNSFLSTHDQP